MTRPNAHSFGGRKEGLQSEWRYFDYYQWHSYIIYKGYRKGGITHDPDCQCHKKGGSEYGED